MSALSLMKKTKEKGSEAKTIQLVSFCLGDEIFGVDIMKVQEIIRWQEVTRMPRMPEFLEGVIDLRGTVMPVVDLRKRFGMGATAIGPATRIIVTLTSNLPVGLVVDSVQEVLKPDESQISPPPAIAAGIGHEYLRGLCRVRDKLVILLDIDRILSSEETASLSSIG